MKNRRTSSILIIFAIILTTLMAIGFSGCLLNVRTYKLNLPKPENLKSISIAQNESIVVIDNSNEMGNFLTLLNSNGRTTKNESIQDEPINTDNTIKVDFNFVEKGVSTIFIYQKNSKYYIEQPYNGIYQISADDYAGVEQLIRLSLIHI